MPKAASKKQYRLMQAIASGKAGKTSRGDSGPPASVAAKYTSPDKDAPESKGKEHKGGRWDKKKDKKKDKVEKALDFFSENSLSKTQFIITDSRGKLLLNIEEGISLPDAYIEGSISDSLSKSTGITPNEYSNLGDSILVTEYHGRVNSSNIKFTDISDINWSQVSEDSLAPLSLYIENKLSLRKSIKLLCAQEELQKNIIRGGKEGVTYELTHGDALKIVGNGTFRMLRDAVEGMTEEDFRVVKFDNYSLHIRKHVNDVYSGRIEDGHKVIHQFTNKSLPATAAELMSVFEWYLPEDEGELEILDEASLDNSIIEGGLQHLIDKYKKHNISNIYSEMENIREEIRQGNAVDLQQVEKRIMKLFDKLENKLLNVVDNHNHLADMAGKDIDEVESKLLDLQRKIEGLGSKPKIIQAYHDPAISPSVVHRQSYPYLPRPIITVSPNGSLKIEFAEGWTPMEQQDFLKDLRAKIIKC